MGVGFFCCHLSVIVSFCRLSFSICQDFKVFIGLLRAFCRFHFTFAVRHRQLRRWPFFMAQPLLGGPRWSFVFFLDLSRLFSFYIFCMSPCFSCYCTVCPSLLRLQFLFSVAQWICLAVGPVACHAVPWTQQASYCLRSPQGNPPPFNQTVRSMAACGHHNNPHPCPILHVQITPNVAPRAAVLYVPEPCHAVIQLSRQVREFQLQAPHNTTIGSEFRSGSTEFDPDHTGLRQTVACHAHGTEWNCMQHYFYVHSTSFHQHRFHYLHSNELHLNGCPTQ